MGFDTIGPVNSLEADSYYSTYFRTSAQKNPDGPPSVRPLVLVISDNHEQFQLISILLRKAGHDVATASDDSTAYQIALERRPVLIICNLAIRSFNGFALIRRIQTQTELTRTPVLLINAERNEQQPTQSSNNPNDPINLALQVANLTQNS